MGTTTTRKKTTTAERFRAAEQAPLDFRMPGGSMLDADPSANRACLRARAHNVGQLTYVVMLVVRRLVRLLGGEFEPHVRGVQ